MTGTNGLRLRGEKKKERSITGSSGKKEESACRLEWGERGPSRGSFNGKITVVVQNHCTRRDEREKERLLQQKNRNKHHYEWLKLPSAKKSRGKKSSTLRGRRGNRGEISGSKKAVGTLVFKKGKLGEGKRRSESGKEETPKGKVKISGRSQMRSRMEIRKTDTIARWKKGEPMPTGSGENWSGWSDLPEKGITGDLVG